MGEGQRGSQEPPPPAGPKWLLSPETRPVWGQAGAAGRGTMGAAQRQGRCMKTEALCRLFAPQLPAGSLRAFLRPSPELGVGKTCVGQGGPGSRIVM